MAAFLTGLLGMNCRLSHLEGKHFPDWIITGLVFSVLKQLLSRGQIEMLKAQRLRAVPESTQPVSKQGRADLNA